MAMVFPTSPTVGQVFTSGSRSWVWNGSAWDSPSAINVLQVPIGLELITSQSFTAQTSFQVNYCFSSKFDNYKVVFNNLVIASGDHMLSWQMVSGTTPISSGIYNSQRLGAQGPSVSGSQSNNQSSGFMGFIGPGSNFISMEMSAPFLAVNTKSITNSHYFPQNVEIQYARLANSTSYDGIRFILASSTMTGNVKIYGYRNEL